MQQTALVSVEEYLNTSYDPDREYVDGEVVERNLGEKDHSRVQRELIGFFWSRRAELGTYCFPEQRVQVTPTRFRVPDVCVYIGGEPDSQIFRTPPFLVIEILSKEDRARNLNEKIEDYLSFGVPYVWVIDPERRRGYIHTPQGSQLAPGDILRTEQPRIEVPLSQLLDQ
jgi:Uma2 family endonuclease